MEPTPPTGGAADAGAEGPAAEPSRLERLISSLRDMSDRTWEAELILSAGVTFALLQVPEVLDQTFLRLDARLGGTPLMLALIMYTYMKLALIVTIACFTIHLISRAYWIALIGLDSAFPGGIRWDRTQYGPVALDEARRLTPSLQKLISETDRFASSLFAFAFVMSAGFILCLVGIPAVAALALAVRRWLLPDAPVGALLLGIGLLIALPSMLASMLDKLLAARGLGPRPERVMRAVLRASHRLFGQRFYTPLSHTIFTNTPKRVMYPLATVFTVFVVAAFMADLIADRGGAELTTAGYVPLEAGAAGVNPRYYDNLDREPSSSALVPSIESDVIAGPYLRLFLPYDPDSDDALVAAACPDLEPLRASILTLTRRRQPPSDSLIDRARNCVASLWTLELNGDPLDPDVSFYRHPITGARGLVAYLPTADMTPGRNLLFLERPRAAPSENEGPDEQEADAPPRRYWIPFWK